MKRLFFVIFLLLITICLTACKRKSENKKNSNVPTYQGMTISKEIDSLKMQNNTLESNVAKSYKSIEELVDISDSKDDSAKVDYYIKKNETFIIEVHISNPADYEIQSFTLNGKKYANYMFKDGSTMELLLLETTAPNESGYVDYTIDAIKYIDGTEIKDVDMSNGDKSIKVGVSYSTNPTATLISSSISATSITLSIDISNPESILDNEDVFLFVSNGNEIVNKESLKIGSNDLEIKNLMVDTDYEFGVATEVDLIDGNNNLKWLLVDTFKTNELCSFESIVSTKESISFNVNYDADAILVSISLYDNDTNEVVKKAESAIDEFSGLLSNHSYKIVLDYKYVIKDIEYTSSITSTVTTEQKVEPTLSITSTTSDKTSISYAIEKTDEDNLLSITKVELLRNNEVIKENGSSLTGSFSDLLSNNTYVVKVTYIYDLNDGSGVHTSLITSTVTTEQKVEPTISLDNVEITSSSINATLNVTDPDGLCAIKSVKLYDEDVLVGDNTELLVSFNSLDFYTNYTIIIAYSYDLNEGKGVQNAFYTKEFLTKPIINMTSCDVLNSSSVDEGGTIFIQARLNNPLNVNPIKAKVNGVDYGLTYSSYTDSILIEIVNNGQFLGGNTTFIIESITADLDTETYVFIITNNNSCEAFINVKLELVSVEYVNNYYEIIEWCFLNEDVYIYITLNNICKYEIVTINGLSDWEKIDDNHYSRKVNESSTGWKEISITSINYNSKNQNYTKKYSGYKAKLLYVYEQVKYIYNYEDFAGISGGYYYELKNDIDLQGVDWAPIWWFNGILDGNGYSIKNLSYVGTIDYEVNSNYGLFTFLSGIVRNVVIDNFRIMIDNALINYEEGEENVLYSFSIGFISGRTSQNCIIDNCTIESNCYFRFNSNNINKVGLEFGGFVGELSYGGKINRCVNKASFDAFSCYDGDSRTIGGICGTISDYCIISNCINYGNIYIETGSDYNRYWGIKGSIGGIIGGHISGTGRKYTLITNSVNCGKLTLIQKNDIDCINSSTGGIVAWYSGVISDCVNCGEIKCNDSENAHKSGVMCLNNGDTALVINSYSLTDVLDDQLCTIEQLNSKDFYTKTLGWSEEIWNLNNLDIENGLYPILR